MPHINGVIARAEAHGDTATLVVYAMVDDPVRHLAVDDPIEMTLHRQPWQSPDGVLEYTDHILGRAGDIVYVEEAGGGLRFDSFHTC